MRKRKIITAIAGAFLGGAMMAAGLVQILDGGGGSSATATAATAPAASSTTLLASSGSSSSVSAADIYSAVRPSVVEIDVSAHVSAGRFGQQQQVQGTGSGAATATGWTINAVPHVGYQWFLFHSGVYLRPWVGANISLLPGGAVSTGERAWSPKVFTATGGLHLGFEI